MNLLKFALLTPNAACAIEVTGLMFDNSSWWSLALEYFGNGEVEEKLSIASDELLSNFPIDKPKSKIHMAIQGGSV